ncbi:ABC transporter permease [Roseicyclus amphidinii]|uniref:ABC transporter permease n=1 Tax=Roseicyclus amphidinii TaxID=3034232 RepID=UPI0032E9EC43
MSLVAKAMRSEAGKGLTLISPTLVYALLLLAAPLVSIVLLSFWTQNFLTIERVFTTGNYAEALTDPLYRELMLRSLRISGMVTLLTVALAFPVAYYISFHVRPDRKSLWLFLITIPFWTSYLIRVFLWRVILAYDGPVNSGLMAVGLIDEPLSWILYNANAVVITLAHAFAPFAILPIFVSLEKIDRSLLEASRDLGESKAMTFLRVTLPLAMPGVLAAVLIVFIPTVGDYVTPRLVGGSGGTMIANMIYAQIFDLNDRPMGATLAVLAMMIVAMVLLWGISRLRFWLWLADRAGGGVKGMAVALAAALAEIVALRALFVLGPALLVAGAGVIVLLALATAGSILIFLRLPKGRWGI